MTLSADVVALISYLLSAVFALALIGIGVSTYSQRKRRAKVQRRTAAVRRAIIEYFRRSDVEVRAECVVMENGRYTAMVESEPMKRFRLSHIIEMTLREHIERASGIKLDKIYWRFPVKVELPVAVEVDASPFSNSASQTTVDSDAPTSATENSSDRDALDELSDEYINEGLEHYRHLPKPIIHEVPWETFEQASTLLRKDAPAEAPPP